MNEYRALLFDLDDTLIDRAAAFGRWVDELMTRWPFLDRDPIIDMDGRGHVDRMTFCDELVTSYKLPVTATALHEEFQTRLPTLFTPEPRSAALLQTLVAAGYKVAIVTNGSSRMQRAKLDRTRLADIAHAVFVSEEVGVAKPARAIFDKALAWTGTAPAETLFVGDDPTRDVAGAARVGMPTVWVGGGTRAYPASLPAPTYTLRSVHELNGILSRT